jgi:predicted RNA-binding Zn-ribbon protein involved in translation (DUF1610 family)
MPQQELFFEREISSATQIKVLKTYDEQFAREAFNSMDDPALAILWLSLKVSDSYDTADIPDQGPESNDFLWEVLLDEAREDGHLRSFFIVTEVKGKSSRSLYVSPDWPDAETFAMELIQNRAIEAQNFECSSLTCGAVFSYRRLSCGHFATPRFCPDCGESLANGSADKSDRSSSSEV